MSEQQIRRLMVDAFGLRIQPNMTRYVQRRLAERDRESIPIIGGNARTGVAVRRVFALQSLEEAAARITRTQ